MRTFALSLFSFCLLALVTVPKASAQSVDGSWRELHDIPQTGRIDDGFFISPDTGWAAWKTVFATEDGGVTWEERAVLPIQPRSMAFATSETGWVGTLAGASGQLLYETHDGGRTYTNITDRIQGDPMLGICGLSVVNPRVVYGVGWCCNLGSGIVKTVDGGQTWTSRNLDDLIDFLIDVHFFDEQRGVATGESLDGRAVVIGTEDGGETWAIRHVSGDEREYGWKLSFPTPDVGYASIEHYRFDDDDGKVLKTTDGGQTWSDVIIPGGGSLQGGGFITPELGWTGGRDVRSETADGGITWERYEGAIPLRVNRFRFVGDSLGYAFGEGVSKYEAGAFTSIAPEIVSSQAPSLSFYPHPAAQRISFAFEVPEGGPVKLSIYDLTGRRVAVVVDRSVGPGTHVLEWEGRDGPRELATGTYIYRLTTEAGVDSGPFIWVQR